MKKKSSVKKLTLLQKAKATSLTRKSKHQPSKEEIELAVAWANGEINLTQMMAAIDTKSASYAYSKLAFALREHINAQTT